ncbi:MAG: site-specific integrase [Nitrososphaerota archaeon]
MLSSSDESLINDYLSSRGEILKFGRIYALRKVIKIFCEVSGCSLSEALEKFRDGGNGLHRVLQIVVSRLEAEGLKPKSVLFYLHLLTSFLGYYDVNYHQALRKVRKPKKATVRVDKIPDTAILQKLILSSKSPRFRMLVQLLAQTGMRLNEALHLRVGYIDFENNVINLPGAITKNGKPRQVPLISELKESLQQYVKSMKMDKKSYLFPSESDPTKPWRKYNIYDLWRKTLSRLGLDERDEVGFKLHPHCLRKFYKTRLEMANVNRLLIMSWMGHDTGVQAVYFMPSPNDLKKEIEKAEKTLRIFGTTPHTLSFEELEALEDAIKFYEALMDHIAKTNPRLLKILGFE